MNNCIFCQIIEGKSPAKFVYKGTEIVAFKDIKPQAPVHILIVPKKHIVSLREVEEADKDLLGWLLLTAKKVAEKLNIADSGFKLMCNNGKAAGQLVDHLHIHLLGGWGDGQAVSKEL